jgi:hypothetical protein
MEIVERTGLRRPLRREPKTISEPNHPSPIDRALPNFDGDNPRAEVQNVREASLGRAFVIAELLGFLRI